MWIEDLARAGTPSQIASRLLEVGIEEMRFSCARSHSGSLFTLADSLTRLMLGLADLPREDPIATDSEWTATFGGLGLWPAYEPSVAAGAYGLSCALSAALEAKMEATAMLAATAPLDALPRKEDRPRGGTRLTGEQIGIWLRAYKMVPPVCDVRLAWIMLAILREERHRYYGIDLRDVDGYRESWRRFAAPETESLEAGALLLGLVLRQVLTPLVDTLVQPRINRPLDFSNLPDLAASRSSMIALYGSRQRVAIAFQERLTALFRSFNGRVVSAMPGDPLGDIYYELPEGDFVLVDAKSTASGRGYGLPRSDADAFRRYVSDAKGLLPTDRHVRAILIVGPSPSARLEAHLIELEKALDCDVRFASAAQVLHLRDAHPGGPLKGFDDALHTCSHVLPENWWHPIVRRARIENERLQQYVRQGLQSGAHGL